LYLIVKVPSHGVAFGGLRRARPIDDCRVMTLGELERKSGPAGGTGREGEGIKRDSTAIVAQGRNDPGFSCLKDHATGASQITIFQGVVARLLRVHDGAASNEHPRIAERDLQRWRAPGSDQLLTVMTDPTFCSVVIVSPTSGQKD